MKLTSFSSLHTKGFTLIETLVSSLIITLVILGPLTLASNASTYARITKDTLIATYLAQEALELLHTQQDSVYIRCIQATSSFVCTPNGSETLQQTAWRLFKARLSGSPSCFASENSGGCAYDFIDMTQNMDALPSKYDSSAPSCDTLSVETSTKLYVCTGAHAVGGGYTVSNFSRSVSIVSVPSITNIGGSTAYDDDLRITVTVTFKRPNGYLHQVKVVDYLHARA